MNFSEVLARLLIEHDLTQADVCRVTGIPTSLMSNYIKGLKSPSLTNAIKLATAFNISLDKLSGIDNHTHSEFENKKSSEENLSLTAHERLLIEAYRRQPIMQPAVDKLLNVPSNANTDALVDDMANIMNNAAEVSTINQINHILKK